MLSLRVRHMRQWLLLAVPETQIPAFRRAPQEKPVNKLFMHRCIGTGETPRYLLISNGLPDLETASALSDTAALVRQPKGSAKASSPMISNVVSPNQAGRLNS